jgi:hypothetical protein
MVMDNAFCLQRLRDGTVNSLQLPVTVTAADDEIVCEGAYLSGIQQDNIGSLLVCRCLNDSLGQFDRFE